MANITKPLGLSNIWANGGTKIDPGTSKVNIGWVVQLPPYEYQNWVDNRQDQAIAHISQHGIPEWDSVTEYQGNLSYTQGSNGLIYKCIATHVNKDPSNALNSAYWVKAFESFGAVQTVSDALAAHINNYQTLSAIGNYPQARTNLSVYSKSESDTRFAGLNGSVAQVFNVAVATQPEHAVRLGQVSSLLTQATEGSLGVVKLATTGVTESGADDLTAITPLKGGQVYLKKSGNLAGMANYATARSNLGLGTIAVEAAGSFLRASNNFSELTNIPVARSNLGLTTTAVQPETYFLRTAYNLSDLPNPAAARSALGLADMAVVSSTYVMFKYDNLAGITNPAVARANLGLSDSGIYPSNTWLIRANNLGDLTNVQAARNNLGLSDMAVIPSGNVLLKADSLAGIGNPAVARANLGLSDSVLYPSNTWLVRSSNLADLPNVAGARANLGLGNMATANVYGILGPDVTFTNNWDSAGGATILPNGMKIQWGTISVGQFVTFRYPFALSYSVTLTHGPNALGGPGAGITSKSNTGFGLGYGTGGYMWIAIGV